MPFFLRIFTKIHHFYHSDRIGIQYYDRIRPAVCKRLGVKNFMSGIQPRQILGVFVTPVREPCPHKTSKKKKKKKQQ
jgi:hypothetical protein